MPGIAIRHRLNGLQGAVTPELSSAGISGVREREAQLRAGPGHQGTTCSEDARREGHNQAGQPQRAWVLGEARPFLFLYLPRDLF